MDQPKTINLDGVSHEVDQFSPGVQQAVAIYNKFSLELQDQQLEVMKTQAALQQVGNQITEAVKAELAAKDAPVTDVSPSSTEEQSAAGAPNGAAPQ
jgi:hypothetical protein